MAMVELYGLSFDQLAERAAQMGLLDYYRALQPFVYLEVNEKRYVFDRTMARTFLLGLINGASCRRLDKRMLQMPSPAQTREPVTPTRG